VNEQSQRIRISFIGTQNSQISSSIAGNERHNGSNTSSFQEGGSTRSRRRKRRLTASEEEEDDDDGGGGGGSAPDDEEDADYVDEDNNDQEFQFEELNRSDTGRNGGSSSSNRKRRRKESKSAETAVDTNAGNEETEPNQVYALTEVEFEALVGNFMRLALFKKAKKELVKREEFIELVLGEGHKKKKGLAQKIIEEAVIRFRKIFGFELTPVERHARNEHSSSSSSQKEATSMATKVANAKSWILIFTQKHDSIQYVNEAEENVERKVDLKDRLKEFQKDADAVHYGLLMVILSLIETHAGHLKEDQLYDYLGQLGLSRETPHPIFGDLDKTIESFVKQLYLERERDDIATQEEMGVGSARRKNKYIYVPGTRLEKELEKRAVLDYMADLCDKELTDATLRQHNLLPNGTEQE